MRLSRNQRRIIAETVGLQGAPAQYLLEQIVGMGTPKHGEALVIRRSGTVIEAFIKPVDLAFTDRRAIQLGAANDPTGIFFVYNGYVIWAPTTEVLDGTVDA